jgi:hypothetical protein
LQAHGALVDGAHFIDVLVHDIVKFGVCPSREIKSAPRFRKIRSCSIHLAAAGYGWLVYVLCGVPEQ